MSDLLLGLLRDESMLPMFTVAMVFTLVLIGLAYMLERIIK